MSDEKEKWIEDVFNSLEGSRRAQPNADLFARIEDQIAERQSGKISILYKRVVAVAAVFLLLLNATAVYQSVSGNLSNSKNIAIENSNEQGLISNYNLYD